MTPKEYTTAAVLEQAEAIARDGYGNAAEMLRAFADTLVADEVAEAHAVNAE